MKAKKLFLKNNLVYNGPGLKMGLSLRADSDMGTIDESGAIVINPNRKAFFLEQGILEEKGQRENAGIHRNGRLK